MTGFSGTTPPFGNQIARGAASVETPAVLVDSDRMARNIARMAELAATGGVALRPHAKTHKSIVIANLQVAAGATGVTVAKPTEAEVFLDAGIASITIASPVLDPAKLRRVIGKARDHGADLRFIADSDAGIDVLATAAVAAGVELPVYLKVDVGLGRCGVTPGSPASIALATRLAGTAGIGFAGLLSHAGHAYRVSGPDEVRQIAVAEREAMTGFAAMVRDAGLAVAEVSVGCTPTTILNGGFDGITEIRPGNYVFMDRIQVALGAADATDVALWVVATVISVNDRFAIIDAGSKVLSSDRGPHGSTSVEGYGLAWRADAPEQAPLTVASVSEEHGFLAHERIPPKVGDRVIIMPNHACTVVNLADALSASAPDGAQQVLPVDARGCVR